MKAITIHGLDDPLWGLLKERAKEQGSSLNATIKGILEQALGIKRTPQQPFRKDFEEFCGVWSKKEYEEFKKNTADDDIIDPKDWS